VNVTAPRSDPVDIRVADSPLVALRFAIDARIADLNAAATDVERELVDATARRDNLRHHLRRNEELRRTMLQALDGHPVEDVVRAFHDGLALTGEAGLIEEQIASLRRQDDELAAEHAVLTSVKETLREISAGGGLSIDLRAARLTRAARRIYHIVDAEHEANASGILDGPMQRLADAALEAELVGRALPAEPDVAAEYAARCRSATLEAAARLRQRIDQLWPVDANQSLVKAVDGLLRGAQPNHTAMLQVVGVARRLDPMIELSAYRIIEEALENALHHGTARRVDVVIAFRTDRLVVLIKDDGEGFDVVATDARMGRSSGLGLIEMRERAALVDGRVEVRSVTGEGTEVRATLPVAS
jgi:signal transduction histidine kinase